MISNSRCVRARRGIVSYAFAFDFPAVNCPLFGSIIIEKCRQQTLVSIIFSFSQLDLTFEKEKYQKKIRTKKLKKPRVPLAFFFKF